jgi:hypothetical protein
MDSHQSGLRVTAREWLAYRFGVDPRALAALRIAVGLLLLVDLGLRARHLTAFYTDAGVLPRDELRAVYPLSHDLSIHALSGDLRLQVLLFVLAAIAVLALLVGYRTRLATASSLVLLLSLHARNPAILNAGDVLLEHLLFWGLFVPLGGRWSVDAVQSGPRVGRLTSVASAALLLQVVVLYSVNASIKLRGQKWLDGTAVQYVFSLEQFVVGIGHLLADIPILLKAMTWVWLGLLSLSVLLIVLTGWSRTVLVGGFAAMHVGMWLTMQLGIFPFISIAALLPFVPSHVWDRFEDRLPERRSTALTDRLPAPTRRVLPTRVRQICRRIVSAVVLVLVVTMVLFNAAAGAQVGGPGIDAETVHEYQQWSMFAPSPPTSDGWYVVTGTLTNGSRIDPFHESPVLASKPATVAAHYRTARWRKFLSRLEHGKTDRRAFAAYLCHDWNAGDRPDLVTVDVDYVAQPTRLEGPEPTRRRDLVRHECPDD